MKIYKFEDMVGGWFVGNFKPAAYETDMCEVCYKFHEKGEKWPVHYHKLGTEINLLINGEMKMHGRTLHSGDIFVMEPWEIANPEFLTDCFVIIVKLPSIPGDKYEITEAEDTND